MQTSARVFHALPGAPASPASQHAITSTRPTLLVRLLPLLAADAAAPLQQARVSVQHRKGAPLFAASSRPHDRVFCLVSVDSSRGGSILRYEWLTAWLVCLLTGGDMAGPICNWTNLLTHCDPQNKSGCMQRVPHVYLLLYFGPSGASTKSRTLPPSRPRSPPSCFGPSPEFQKSMSLGPLKLGHLQRSNGSNNL